MVLIHTTAALNTLRAHTHGLNASDTGSCLGGLISDHAKTHARARAYTHTRTRTLTHAHAHTHTDV